MSEFEIRMAPGHLLRRAQQIHAAVFAETVTEADLTTPQFGVLAVLRVTPKIDQVQLSQRLGIDRSTIADVAARLEERGLIKRERDKTDGRRNVLSLTTKGRSVYERTLPEVLEVGRRLLKPLSTAQSVELLSSLSAIIASYDPNFAHESDL